jgi:hypothetical protein
MSPIQPVQSVTPQSACTVGVHELGIVGKELYLLDVLRRRMEYPELKPCATNTRSTAPVSC